MATFAFAVIAALTVVGGILFFLIRLEIRHASAELFDRLNAFHKGSGYPGGTAVVTAAAPSSGKRLTGEPALARSTFAGAALPIVDDDATPSGSAEPTIYADDEGERETDPGAAKVYSRADVVLVNDAGEAVFKIPADVAAEAVADPNSVLGGILRERADRAQRVEGDTLVSAGMMLAQLDRLTPDERAAVEALATQHGIPAEAMLGRILATGSSAFTANDREVPPSGKDRRRD